MADCKFLKGCIFFNDQMPVESEMGATYKKQYCLGDSSNCARYMVATSVGREKVPGNLYPDMKIEAKLIIRNG